MNYVFRLFAALLILVGGAGLTADAQKRRAAFTKRPRAVVQAIASPLSDTVLPPAAQLRVDAFLKAWETLRQNYFDPTFNNLDWNKIKAEFEPRVRAAKTDGQLYALLNEMIGRLQRSHLAVITPEVYQAIERAKVEAKAREAQQQAKRSADDTDERADAPATDTEINGDLLTQYGIGVELRLLDNRFVITEIDKNSSSALAGLKTGYIVERINGVSLDALLRRIESQNSNSSRIKKYLPLEVVGSFLNGEKDSLVSVSVIDENNARKDFQLRRLRIVSETISLGRNFPERQLRFESASIGDSIGYIKFNFFAIPVIGKFCEAIGQFRNKKALIIDLRGNMGGVMASMVALAGMLTESSIDLGTSIYNTGSENLTALSKAKNFKEKIVILVDNQTVSAAEVFAASMQDAGRALVIGEKTAGEALPSVALDLPTGAVLLYPIANYKSPSGRYLEGMGVLPDFTVSLTRKALLEGRDEQLDAAMTAIADDTAFSKAAARLRSAVATDSRPMTQSKQSAGGNSSPGPSASEPPQTAAPLIEPRPISNVKQPAALKVIADFVESIGGDDALKAVETYSLGGTAELLVKGTKNEFELGIYFQKPGKYAEILKSDAAGEIREIYNGGEHFVQTDYGLTQTLPPYADTGDLDLLAPIRSVSDPDFYKSLVFVGTFDRDGRKVNIVDARTRDGYYLALAFDAETKELVSFVGSYYSVNFSDYRKTGALKLPYRIEREGVMNITLESITLNAPVDESKFLKKQNCFDKEN